MDLSGSSCKASACWGARNHTCASAALTAVTALAATLGCGASGALMPGTVTYTWQEMPQIRHGRASGAMPGPDVATCPADVHRCNCRASCWTCTMKVTVSDEAC